MDTVVTAWSVDDLDFAKDLALLSNSHSQMQDKITCFESRSARIALHINNGKTKIMRRQHASNSQVTIAGQLLEVLSQFFYLFLKHGWHTGWDRRRCEDRNRQSTNLLLILKKVWSSKEIGKSTKLKIFNTNGKSVLLYGSETRRMTPLTLHELQKSINSCLHKIICIRRPEKTTNEDLWRTADQEPVNSKIHWRK